MKTKTTLSFIALLAIVNILAYIFNFVAIYDGEATLTNFIMTLLVILVWISLALFAHKSKYLLTCISIYWLGIFFFSLIGFIQSAIEWYPQGLHDLMLMFIILFYPAFGGLVYLFSFTQVFLITSLISLAFIIYCIICIHSFKKNQTVEK